MDIIEIEGFTKDYGHGRGVFDLDLSVPKGQCFGFLGPNGAGKTTAIRHLMGFSKPDSGSVRMAGMDCWRDSAEIMRHVCYLPAEIAFPRYKTGMKFLEAQAEYAGVKDTVRRDELIERLMLDPSADLKRMSKGMKQKTAIIAALMGEHEILILDEPTTGLDPYMRQTFMKILLEERDRGRTIFMSSHLFDEVEAVCERVVMIRGGHIVDDITMYELEHERPQVIELDFDSVGDCAAVKQRFSQLLVNEEIQRDTRCVLSVPSNDLSRVLGSLGGMSVSCIDVHRETLEERFNETYREAYEDTGLNGGINGQER